MDVFEAMGTARAIRYLKPDPVPRELIEKIVWAATRASSPGNSQGWDFVVVTDEAKAREVSEFRRRKLREKEHVSSVGGSTMEQMFAKIKAGVAKELAIVVKADVQGSVEAAKDALEKLSTSEVRVRILRAAVGNIGENDVLLASASNAI